MTVAMIAERSCGSCRDRHVYCDRVIPVCSQCVKSKRKCKGYGLRLSWPRDGDRRRAILGKAPYRCKTRHNCSKALVQVTPWDVQMHYHLASVARYGEVQPITRIPPPTLHIPMWWNPSTLVVEDRDLLQYFETSASQSLTTFGHDPKALGQVLIRIALTSTTPSASAVLKGVLALSSLHRYGVQTQAFRLKISTLKSLAAASTCNLGAREVIQHVAAGMLLCSFEVHQASCTSSQWTWYIAGVKSVLNGDILKPLAHEGDLKALMDWVYYHDVMSHFTLRHWQGAVAAVALAPGDICRDFYSPVRTEKRLRLMEDDATIHTDPSMLSILKLLAELSDTVFVRPRESMSFGELEDYKGYIGTLDWRIRNISMSTESSDCSNVHAVAELYQLATLVYLNRVSSDLLDQKDKIQAHIDRAFALFAQMSSCERQFPLFILGCEAQTDEQRQVVLELLDRTGRMNSSRSLNHIKILVQALWAQDDLAEQETDYWNKLTGIISSCTIIPSLV